MIDLDAAAEVFEDGMKHLRPVVGEMSREQVADRIADNTAGFDPNVIRTLAVMAILALLDEEGSHAMTASSFETFVESMAEQARAAEAIANGYKAEIARVQQSAIEHAERHRRIFDAHLRQVAELTDQRDEARGQARAMAATAERFHAAILNLEDERDGLKVELDEARAEVVRLGKALQKADDDQCGCLGTVET